MAFRVTQSFFGRSPDGAAVNQFSLEHESGFRAVFIDWGATLVGVLAADRSGDHRNVVLSEADGMSYLGANEMYLGSTVGRVANRVAGGTFKLNGETYELAKNNGPNSLHGGAKGWSHKLWRGAASVGEDAARVEFSLASADGDEGYPSALEVRAAYEIRLDGAGRPTLLMEYRAVNVGEKSTPVNMTNHAYWNLSGDCARDVKGHVLKLFCDAYLPVDGTSIPIGGTQPVAGTPFDFRSPAALGQRIPDVDGGGRPGLDHCFVVRGGAGDGDAGAPSPPLREIAELRDPGSGRVMRVRGTQPGVQVYTGNWLGDMDSAEKLRPHNAVCLETQHFPDSPNQFPDEVMLPPGATYSQRAAFDFGVDG